MREWVRRKLVRKLFILLLLPLTGCNSTLQHTASQELPLAQIDMATGAAISGRVLLDGKAPEMPVLDMSANPACQRSNKKPRHSEQVLVNSDGTLRNTFVWVKAGLPKARWNPPDSVVTLDQQGCVYVPHVLGLMVGQTLEISNSDTVNHNVHTEGAVNPASNDTVPPRAEKKLKQFDSEEVMIPVSCGVHPWMHSYLGVVAHPFFYVTGDNGAFSLKGLPPGTYTLEAVHERYGKKEMTVTVAARDVKDVSFHYDAATSH